MDAPPPPPPPHGEKPQNAGGPNGKRGGLPDGHYDIFVVPPQSAGGGFIYFPSLQPQRNSFIAGSLCTLLLVVLWWVITPVLKEWFSMIIASGGAGVALLLVLVAAGAWGLGRVNLDGGSGSAGGSGTGAKPKPFSTGGAYANTNGFQHGPAPDSPPHSENFYQHSRQGSYNFHSSTSSPPPPRTDPGDSAKGAWERAREETRKREEEKRKAEELRRKADDLRRKREEAEKEKQKEREKEAREREIRERRERLAKEREERLHKEKEAKENEEKEKLLREIREKEAKEKAARDAQRAERLAKLKADREERSRAASGATSPPRSPSPQKAGSNFKQASARTEADQETMYSFRPYDKPKSPKKAPTAYTSSQSSFAASSYAASESTARSTPPPSHARGPYSTKDPDKIVIKAVYAFNSALNRTPLSTLQSGIPPVSDGLVLRITTEGMFIDDDLRGVPQREWDVKAWTLKTVETGQYRGIHLLRASIRDAEGKKYVFVFGSDENWKADQGVSRLRKSPQARALGVSGLGLNEAKSILESTGWV